MSEDAGGMETFSKLQETRGLMPRGLHLAFDESHLNHGFKVLKDGSVLFLLGKEAYLTKQIKVYTPREIEGMGWADSPANSTLWI